MARDLLPPDLGDVFSVRSAREAGVSPKRLRGSDLDRPFHGVRALPAVPDVDELTAGAAQRRDIVRAMEQYAERMAPDEFFAGSSAAIVWGAPLPLLPDAQPHVALLAPRRLVRTEGVHAHEARPHLVQVVTHAETGWRMTTPASTWATVAAELWNSYDLVAVGDHLVRVPRMPGGFHKQLDPPLTTLEALEATVFAGRRIGRPRMREALPRVRTAAASRPETWMRLLVVDSGLPEPELDHDVYDDHGAFVGCVDGAYPRRRVALEYEGDHHRVDVDTWNRDIRKHDALAALGWRVIRVTKADVFQDSRPFLARLRSALISSA
ncbi:endonuclease domain-containing protein [Microbacterium sp. CJ88]|uniref:endonuclease domain-containing protein n=1 Tax=Microbacterium sp. CJ88 TaxID=3445672 RepID=UPI003F65B2C1